MVSIFPEALWQVVRGPQGIKCYLCLSASYLIPDSSDDE